jgi:hypothetical protein
MEGQRSSTYPENHSESGSDKKKKDSRRGSSLRFPVVKIEQDAAPAAPKKESAEPKPASAFDEALAALAIKRREQAAPKPEAETVEPATKKHETSTETPDEESEEKLYLQDEAVELGLVEPHSEASDAEAEADYEELPSYTPEPAEFNGGEVIIDLTGETPVSERVIMLHEEASEEQPKAEQAESHAEAEEPLREQPEQPRMQVEDEPEHTSEQAPEPEQDSSRPTIEAWPNAEHFDAGEPPIPPRGPGQTSGEFIPPDPEPIQSETEMAARPHAARRGTSGEALVATQQDVDDAVYYATKTGQQRGLVTGLLVGGAYEHFKHRRREKKAAKRFKQQGKQLEQAKEDFKFKSQEQEQRQAETNRKLASTERRLDGVEKQPAVPERLSETSIAKMPEAAVVKAPEKQLPIKQPEKLMVRTPEQRTAEEVEQLNVPADHHIETSAWHSIEVDSRTGKVVEQPTFVYGEEYHRERAPENLGAADPASEGTHPTPEVLADVAAASQIPSATTRDSNSPPTQIPNATVQGPPASAKDKAKEALLSLTKSDSPANSGPLWPWLLALVVVVILLAIVL